MNITQEGMDQHLYFATEFSETLGGLLGEVVELKNFNTESNPIYIINVDGKNSGFEVRWDEITNNYIEREDFTTLVKQINKHLELG